MSKRRTIEGISELADEREFEFVALLLGVALSDVECEHFDEKAVDFRKPRPQPWVDGFAVLQKVPGDLAVEMEDFSDLEKITFGTIK